MVTKVNNPCPPGRATSRCGYDADSTEWIAIIRFGKPVAPVTSPLTVSASPEARRPTAVSAWAACGHAQGTRRGPVTLIQSLHSDTDYTLQ